ncbi:uroporphyrinogen-III C-methyltransferase [Sulfurovum sp.]|uniref:uroporphyrinogen-III C-methyltransferase n=1 Tax=Sulfurovum sp. TaxID=1969726 RepID=UPI002867CDAC|nr:uroporphyrinogen-III C-methyltransferase [Sulfurovum sp.]
MGKVYLTGAGPGDMELLTLKALRVVQEADVIIYDRLVNPNILKEAKSSCECIYVGKEDKHHILPQDQINALLYEKAQLHDVVVRLKGGDSVVFGRGGEEALFLAARGVEFAFIPGITSAIAVPEMANIPITHRGKSVSFRVVTGYEAPQKGYAQLDWNSFRQDETIIFLMGLHQLKKISTELMAIGKPASYPVAVISRGTLDDEKVVISTLENIYEEAKDLPTPALIVVGEVVKVREALMRVH